MPTHCCVPLCTLKGYTSQTGEKTSYFVFPKDQNVRRQWIRAIRRDEGKDFKIISTTKVCSRHFEATDTKKSLSGIITLKPGAVPTKFSWTVPSNKRKAPMPRPELASKVAKNNPSVNESLDETFDVDACPALEESQETLKEKITMLESELKEACEKIRTLESENATLQAKLSPLEGQYKTAESRVFTVEHFTSNEDMCYYTGFPNYQTFLAVFNFLESGEKGENIRYCSTNNRNVPDDFYDVEDDSDNELYEDVEKPRKP